MNKKTNDAFDELEKLTKDELIEFIKTKLYFSNITKREVCYFKWEKESKKLQKERADNLTEMEASTLGKEIDELARKFNETKDIKYLEKRQKLFDEYKKLMKKFDITDKKEAKLDRYYNENLRRNNVQ